jgi:hypothetical protein
MERIFKRGETLTNEEFIRRAKDVYGDRYDYSHVEYIGSKYKVKIKCKDHGIFYQAPADHLSGHGCLKCFHQTRHKWTTELDNILKNNYSEKGANWCAENTNKSVVDVQHRVTVLKLTKKQKFHHKEIPSHIWNSLLQRVREDGYSLDFDIHYVWEMYLEQHGKCALTGWNIKFGKKNIDNEVSIDRIDSSKGYLKTNVQLTHKWVNRCKLNCHEKFFYEICSAVTRHRNDLQNSEIIWENDIYNDTEHPVQVNSKFHGPRILKFSNANTKS